MKDLVVADSDDAVAKGIQLLRAEGVIRGLIRVIVNISINLDGKLPLRAPKVENEGTDRVLAAEPEPGQASPSQGLP